MASTGPYGKMFGVLDQRRRIKWGRLVVEPPVFDVFKIKIVLFGKFGLKLLFKI